MKIYFCKVSKLLQKMSEEELYKEIPDWRKKNVDSYKNKDDRQRSLAASYLLCQCMKDHHADCQKAPVYTKAGKMYFPHLDKFYVNLSHGSDYAVCVWDQEDIGVDIEGIRQYKDSVVKKVCTQDEIERLNTVTDTEKKEQLFSELWTIKESRVKLTGEGIAGLLKSEPAEKTIYTRVYYPCKDCFLSISSFSDNFCEKIEVF